MVEPRIVQRAPLGLRPTVLRAALQEVNMRASRQGLNRMLKRLGQNLSLRPPTPQTLYSATQSEIIKAALRGGFFSLGLYAPRGTFSFYCFPRNTQKTRRLGAVAEG